jgi:hypothetical protein
MITGFNPADIYGIRHIEKVLRAFPGVEDVSKYIVANQQLIENTELITNKYSDRSG